MRIPHRVSTAALAVALSFAVFPAGCRPPLPDVTTATLFAEMADLARLASFPEPAYRTVEFSSYDRKSRIPGGPDWYANADGFGGEPEPCFAGVVREPDASGAGEYLIADVAGPGAVVRLWTAAISGEIRVWIDGSDKALFEGPAEDVFRHPYDRFPQIAKISKTRFASTVYQRDASYAPIPFAKRLRAVWKGKIADIHFYQMQVRLYSPGTRVASFKPEDIEDSAAIIDRATLALSDPDRRLPGTGASAPIPFTAALETGGKRDVLSLEGGPGAVSELSLRLRADDIDSALRQTVLRIVCDGHVQPQVESPVGDFFGAAPGINPYVSLPFSVRPDGTMVCRFVMPYERSLRVGLENYGPSRIEVEGSARTAPFVWDERSLHFRARWRMSRDIVASGEEAQDLPFLVAVGRGVYVGTASFLLNPSPVPTSWGNWWGEGDEKVFVDGEASPSWIGTGSEDYYNYSWSAPDIFFFPYCGQPRNDGPGNRGFVTNVRWQVLDAIPFRRDLRFTMELMSHERTPGLSYARIGYHYAAPGTTDDHEAIMPADVKPERLPRGWLPAARFGARGSVFIQVEDILGGRRGTRLEEGDLWAGGKLLVWAPEKDGDRLEFRLNLKEGGKRRLHLTAALTPRAGSVRALLDGRALPLEDGAETIGLYDPYRTLLRDFAFKEAEMEAGEHVLTLAYAGGAKGPGRPEIGLDFLWIQFVGKPE